MEQTTESQLAAILEKEPTGLTAADAAFLRARRGYLTEDQRITYASVLDDTAPAPADEPASDSPSDPGEDAPAPKKKAK